MDQKNRSIDETLSPSAEQRISGVCARFRAAWKSGDVPAIDEYLAEAGQPDRVPLLRRLLLIELKYRSGTGETMSRERYQKLFPDHVELIDSVFSSAQVTPSLAETVDPSAADTGSGTVRDVAGAPVAEGERFGRFQLMEALGRGGFGAVYRAYDPQLDREVALKFPRAGTLVDERDVQRFMREARAAAQLRHPNLVPVYEAGEIDGTCYIASAYVPGKTLRDTVKDQQGKQFTHRQAATLAAKLAEALHFAHQKGIVHRDMKPENVMIDQSGQPHIMDFGLARRDEGEELLTQEGSQMGTPAYMSPEQVKGESHTADARTDLWALGVMLYELLTARRPFEVRSAEALVKIVRDEPQPPRKLDRSIPKDLETICLKCMNKHPDARYESCQAVHDELQRWLHGEPIQARPISRVERTWRWCRRKPALSGLAASIVVLTLILTFGAVQLVLEPTAQPPAFQENTLAQTGSFTIAGKLQRHDEFVRGKYIVRISRPSESNKSVRAFDVKGEAGNTSVKAGGEITISLTELALDRLELSAEEEAKLSLVLVKYHDEGKGPEVVNEAHGIPFKRTDLPVLKDNFKQREPELLVQGDATHPEKLAEDDRYSVWLRIPEADPVLLDKHSDMTVNRERGSITVNLKKTILHKLGVQEGQAVRLFLEVRVGRKPDVRPISAVSVDFEIPTPPPIPTGIANLVSLEPPNGKVVMAQRNDLLLQTNVPDAFEPQDNRSPAGHNNVVDGAKRILEWLKANEAPTKNIEVLESFIEVLESRPAHVEFIYLDEKDIGAYAWDILWPYYEKANAGEKIYVLIQPNMHYQYLRFAMTAYMAGSKEEGQCLLISDSIVQILRCAYLLEVMQADFKALSEEARMLRELEGDYRNRISHELEEDGNPFPYKELLRYMSADEWDALLEDESNRNKIEQLVAACYVRRFTTDESVFDFLAWTVGQGFYSEEKASTFLEGRRLYSMWHGVNRNRHVLHFKSLFADPVREKEPWEFHARYLRARVREAVRAAAKGPDLSKGYAEQLYRGSDVRWVYGVLLAHFEGLIDDSEMDRILLPDETRLPEGYVRWMRTIWTTAKPHYEYLSKSIRE